MSHSYSDQQLQAYLDESLAPEKLAAIERELRENARLREHLIQVAGAREAGIHGIGEIWRRHRISCPSRQQLGGFLLGAVDDQLAEYIRFHCETIECRICKANLEDLRQRQSETQSEVQSRRRRYFQTSAGYLKGTKQRAEKSAVPLLCAAAAGPVPGKRGPTLFSGSMLSVMHSMSRPIDAGQPATLSVGCHALHTHSLLVIDRLHEFPNTPDELWGRNGYSVAAF